MEGKGWDCGVWAWALALPDISEPPGGLSTALFSSRTRANFISLSVALHWPCWFLGVLCHNDLQWGSAGARVLPLPPCVPHTNRCCDLEACLSPPWLMTSF